MLYTLPGKVPAVTSPFLPFLYEEVLELRGGIDLFL